VSNTLSIFKRELGGYFATPVAYVFIVIFLLLTGIFTFYVGGFFEFGRADLQAFFSFHPWLYLFLIPAISMRLWAEERKSGTVELLMSLPVTTGQAVMGKFLAAWVFTGIALALTFPLWITVNYLGEPDNGVIVASYIGSLLMAGAYLAIGSCISALTKNQVIAFVIAFVVCLMFVITGVVVTVNAVQEFLPEAVVRFLGSLSFDVRFRDIQRGVIDLRDIIYFISLAGCWLFANVLVLDIRKAR
jgi:ABC-2 type transport system permease protein